MFKIFKESFYKTNDCIILTVPLIIFLSIIGWYFAYAKEVVNTPAKLIFSYITLIVMFAGLGAAWFYTVKKALNLSNKVIIFDSERTKELLNLFKQLPRGVGKLFFPMFGVLIFISIIYAVFFIIVNHFTANYLAPVNITTLGISCSFMSTNEIWNEIMELSNSQLIALNFWYIITFIFSIIFAFLGLLWVPEIVYGEKNPFKALIYAVQKVFINFKGHTLLFSFILLLYFMTSLADVLLMIYPACYFIVLLISYYFILYVVVLLFTYYERIFIKGAD